MTLVSYNTMALQYPNVPVDPGVKDKLHGKYFYDRYRWLENLDSEEVNKFINEQNQLTDNYLQSCRSRKGIQDCLDRATNFVSCGCPVRRGDNYFCFKNGKVYKLDSLDESLQGDVILDPSKFPGNVTLSSCPFEKNRENFVDAMYAVSINGQYLAYGLSENGSPWSSIHFVEIFSGRHYPDVLTNVRESNLSWGDTNQGIFYVKYPTSTVCENGKIFYHVLGSPQITDRMVVEFPQNSNWKLIARVSECGSYLVIFVTRDCLGETLVFLKDTSQFLAGSPENDLIPLVREFVGSYKYITNAGSIFYFLTNVKSPRGSIVRIDVLESDTVGFHCVLEEQTNRVLEWAKCVNQQYLVTCYIHDMKSYLQLRRLEDGSLLKTFRSVSSTIGTISDFSGSRNESDFFFKFSSFLNPGTIYHVEMRKQQCQSTCNPGVCASVNVKQRTFKTCQLLSGINLRKFRISHHVFKGKTCPTVSLFLVHKGRLHKNGNTPCLLYVHGGFEESMQPQFNPMCVLFVHNFNGIFGVVNVRGAGGWYGQPDKAYPILRHKKQDVFDDFRTAVEYLHSRRYTCPAKTAITGSSTGGLVVAACGNRTPTLYGAVIAGFGFMDMLRLDGSSGSYWKSEYGGCDSKLEFWNLLSYSPLHNVRWDGNGFQHPATLLITGESDDRVLPFHSYKMMAELQSVVGASPQQENPLLLRVDNNARCRNGTTFDSPENEIIDVSSFLMLTLHLSLEQ